MSDTFTTNDDWSLKKKEVTFATWGDAQDGVDAIVEIVSVGNPARSSFQMTDSKTKEPLWERDQDGKDRLDGEGNRIPRYSVQVTVDYEVVDLIDYEDPGDQPKDQFIGERIRNFYTWSMNDGKGAGQAAGLYLLAKAVMGGAVDEKDYELRKSHLEGKMVKGTIAVGPPKGDNNRRYPKLTTPRAVRGATATAAKEAAAKVKKNRPTADPVDPADPPF